MENLLVNSWNSNNVNNLSNSIIKPKEEVKQFKSDSVLIYEGKTTSPINSIGALSRNVFTPVSIDIYGFVSRAQTIKILKEVDRIIMANLVVSGATYPYIQQGDWGNVSNPNLKRLWHYVYDVRLEKHSEVI